MEPRRHQRGLCGFNPLQAAGCGATGGSTGPASTSMRLSITSTTGSPVEVTVPRGETVEGLRSRISHRLRLHTDRIVLLHKDRHLTAGKLLDQSVTDGSKLTLVPVIEAGLVAQCSTTRIDKTTMGVLESLTDVQINDFLCGRSPLTISLRIGIHMMYVQLQLSAQDVKKLQQERDCRPPSSDHYAASARPSTNTTGSNTCPAPHASSALPDSPDTPSSLQFSSQRPRTSLNPAALSSHSPTGVPAVKCHNPSPLPHSQTHPHPLSNPPLPSSCPHPSSPRQATTPVCWSGPSGFSPGPPSPAPAATFTESKVNGSSPAELSKQPGAVIESLVSHSPGVFSGTFSGTLAPCSQTSTSHPRHGISIILQILNDLLRAACHPHGASPAPPPQHLPASNPPDPDCPLITAEETQSRASSRPPTETQRMEPLSKPTGGESSLLQLSSEENQTLHCKLERLQRLMHQRRLRRNLSPTSRPYPRYHHHP